ncbi:MAG: lipoprotein [Gammaproteobacteria bacterium]
MSRNLFIILIGLFCLSACGVKGPLTLPEAESKNYETR